MTTLSKTFCPLSVTKRHAFDDDNFRCMHFLAAENHLLCVKAIIWNILPNVRRDGTLSSQAKMINMFKEKDIWNNVIIVCKKSRDPGQCEEV